MSVWGRLTSTFTAQKYHGLQNQGATCYLNSVLQVLFMTKDFREAVIRNGGKDESFQTDLKNLFEQLEKRESSTSGITTGLGIRSGQIKGDAAECFEKILNSLNNEEASRIFSISLTHKNVCVSCRKGNDMDAQFWHLPIELVEETYRVFELEHGIERFFSESKVTGEDKLYCEKCEEKTDSDDKFEMKHHPEVLTLLLKRFKFDWLWNKYMKIQCSVNVPYRITVEGQKYELYAFVEHYGELKVGHYVVSIKSEADGKWYEFNDTVVLTRSYQPFQSDPSYRSQGAYLLFYRKEKETSPQDEASHPAGFTPGTPVNDDHHGNSVKGDKEAAGGRRNYPASEGRRANEDEERAQQTFTPKKVVSEDKGGRMTVDHLRHSVDLKSKYDLVYSCHNNATGETKHDEENREAQQEEAESENSFDTVYDSANGREVKDKTSGRDYQLMRAGQHRRREETHSNKPKGGVSSQHELQRCRSERGGGVERDERAPRAHARGEGEAGARESVEEKYDGDAADVESLTEDLSNMTLKNSTQKSDKSTQTLHISVNFPSTLEPLGRNTGALDWQRPCWVTNLVCGNCQSVAGILQTDTHSNTYTFTPTVPLVIPGREPAFAENTVFLPNPTASLPHTPTLSHMNDHQRSSTSGGRVASNLYYYLPCRKYTGQDPK